MAEFTPSKKTAQDFNNGIEYIDGQGNETGDALQAETINNLVESALYTQGQADSAKQTAQGALSQVNQVLADKTLLPDVQKNYYNLDAFDTYVPNGDGTGTITRRTRYLIIDANSDIQVVENPNGTYRCVVARNLPLLTPTAIKSNYLQRASFDDVYLGRQCFAVYNSVNVVVSILGVTTESEYRSYFSQHPLIFQYELADKYQYTEKVIENQPIHIANQEECLYWHEEWRKKLNLIDLSKIESGVREGVTFTINNNSIVLNGESTGVGTFGLFDDLDKVKGKTITLSGKISDNIFLEGDYVDSDGITHYFNQNNVPDGSMPVYIPENARSISVYCGVRSGVTASNATIYPMLNYGINPYPYEPYYGGIVRERDLSGIQLFPEDVNPAETIGGDWEDKGTVTTSDNTVFHAYRRL